MPDEGQDADALKQAMSVRRGDYSAAARDFSAGRGISPRRGIVRGEMSSRTPARPKAAQFEVFAAACLLPLRVAQTIFRSEGRCGHSFRIVYSPARRSPS